MPRHRKPNHSDITKENMGLHMASNDEPTYLSYESAARYLEVHRRTLERAVAANKIPYVRDPLTGRVRFRVDEIEAWLHGPKAGRK